MDSSNLIEDAKFYQDAAVEYQSAYEALQLQQEELQSRYTQQACSDREGLLEPLKLQNLRHLKDIKSYSMSKKTVMLIFSMQLIKLYPNIRSS